PAGPPPCPGTGPEHSPKHLGSWRHSRRTGGPRDRGRGPPAHPSLSGIFGQTAGTKQKNRPAKTRPTGLDPSAAAKQAGGGRGGSPWGRDWASRGGDEVVCTKAPGMFRFKGTEVEARAKSNWQGKESWGYARTPQTPPTAAGGARSPARAGLRPDQRPGG